MFSHNTENTLPTDSHRDQVKAWVKNVDGKVGVPILLYLLGVPGVVVIVLWAVFFRG